MLFSEHYGIDTSNGVDWFDPILDYDTKLFIDPFLVEKKKHLFFRTSYSKIIKFFEAAFTIAATTSRNKKSLKYLTLIRLNSFPEVKELCLGYASNSTKGSGSGQGFGQSIVEAILDSIDRGVVSLPHFEELGIFNNGIGADRISDITANLIKTDLIRYTQTVCARNNIPTKEFKIRVLDKSFLRWDYLNIQLPENPFYVNQAVLLVPARFINNIPSINNDDFFDFCTKEFNENLRLELNTTVLSNMNKEEIIKIAKKHRDWVDSYLDFKASILDPKSYDLTNDPKGYYVWAKATKEFAVANPISLLATNQSTFHNSIEILVNQFKNYLELNGGHKLLWDGIKSKSEEATQLLFYGIGKTYCQFNNIDITREAEMGRGPVDFKFSSGYKNKILLEVKLAKNGKFWHGLEKQFIYYLEAEGIKDGYFMVVCYTDKDFEKVKGIENEIDKLNKKLRMKLKAVIIDATNNKPSASNI